MKSIVMPKIESSGLARGICTLKGEGPWKGLGPESLRAYGALGKELRADPLHMLRVRQMHTDRVLLAGRDILPGDGVVREAPQEGADGLVTDVPGLVLCVVTADCVPVFLLDPVKKAAGLVHSGWKGTAACIAVKAAELMQKEFGSRPEDLLVSIGPHNCAKCYEVGEDLLPEFRTNYSEAELARIFRKRPLSGMKPASSARAEKTEASPAHAGDAPVKYLLDLSEAIRLSLARFGVLQKNMEDSGLCTFEDPRLWSWRRDRSTEGRILSALMLK